MIAYLLIRRATGPPLHLNKLVMIQNHCNLMALMHDNIIIFISKKKKKPVEPPCAHLRLEQMTATVISGDIRIHRIHTKRFLTKAATL